MRFRTRREAVLVRQIEAILKAEIPSSIVTLTLSGEVPHVPRQKQIIRAAARNAGVRVRMHETMDPPGLRVLVLKEGEDE